MSDETTQDLLRDLIGEIQNLDGSVVEVRDAIQEQTKQVKRLESRLREVEQAAKRR